MALLLMLCAACAARADTDQARGVDALMRPYQGEVPGASVLVIRNGRPLIRRAYGYADLEHDVRATPATNYRLASVTKQFTAAAILLLAQEGRLSLADPVRRWLPTLPAAVQPVTIRQLLTHTSGLIDYEEVMPESNSRPLHDSDVLHLLEAQNRTYFPPGSQYRYSDSGYSLLSLIVARASGSGFATFLHERIFAPLGMRHTVAYEEGVSRVSNRAYGYSAQAAPTRSDGAAHPVSSDWVRTDQSLTSAVLGDGGIYSSVDDLSKWDAALYGGGPLSDESLRLAFTAATGTDDPQVAYGFGWRITGQTVWHSGETIGFRNVIVRYPARHFTVIVLTNRNDPEPYTLALAIAKLYYPDADAVHASAVVVGPDSGAHPLPAAH
ncbi:MAG: beta-lactamase family protein [Gammaproteobacteria bacterium]|nr:beta-lactamase family protein [Gammaproteobacteria bacterium]